MSKNILVSLFNGASIAQKAISDIGIKIEEVYTSEVDKFALIHEEAKYPTNIKLGDVQQIDFINLREEILAKYPNATIILVGGSPCQNLSFIGNRKGLSTKCNIEITTLSQYLELKKDGFEFIGQSYLFWEFERAREELEPDYFFIENVRMSHKNKDIFDSAIGIIGVLYDSALVSAQQRKRYYWFNWEKPIIRDRGIKLSSIIDNSIPFRELGDWVYSVWSGKRKLDKLRTFSDAKAFTLTTSKTHSSQYYLNKDRTMYRNFTPNEYEALQTFPKDWTKINGVPDGQRYKMIGNSWTLEIIKEIFAPLASILKREKN